MIWVLKRMYLFNVCVLLQATCAFCFENIALHKPTWQEHPWSDDRFYRGENAVDGIFKDRSANGGKCTISANNKSTALWRVDLGSVVSISHIVIYYRTDNKPNPTVHKSRMAGFYLYVSKTTSKEDGHLCFHDDNTIYGLLSEDQKINCTVYGRYVIYYNERKPNVVYPSFYSPFAYNELCEVEVYGCRNSGVYGNNCTMMCPVNCKEGQCDINSGHCLSCVLGYQGPTCNTTHTIKDDESSGPTFYFIIGGIVGAVIILMSTVTITIAYNRKTKRNHEETKRREESLTKTRPIAFPKSTLYSSLTCLKVDIEDGLAQPGLSKSLSKHGEETQNVSKNMKLNDDDVDIDEKRHEENPYGDLYLNEKPIPDIVVANLGNVIEENSKNEDDGFKKNYSTLLYGERYPCEIGKRPENVTKNRFKTTFPYDHSRVQLVTKESDYINANHIDGICKENCFIATQGPTQYTVGDFWLMVWQEHVEQIVMLTNLIEGPKTKCSQYWPDLEATMACDMFILHTITERHYAFYSIRVLSLTKNMDVWFGISLKH